QTIVTQHRRSALAALLLAMGCARSEPPRVPDSSASASHTAPSLRTTDVHLFGDSVGPVPVSASPKELARYARVIRDTVEYGMEANPESVTVLVVAGDTLRAVYDGGHIYRLDVRTPTFRTVDSLGVGTTLARLLQEPGVHASGGEGALYVVVPRHCGVSFGLSQTGELGDASSGDIGPAQLRRLPPATHVSDVIVSGCERP
ncbi:MAG TPA: hypothetical protein VF461_15850, partial [Gemmatimonadaceae bacterium]